MDSKVLSTGIPFTNLPESYIRPESERPRLSEVANCENVPIINLGCEDRAQLIEQLADACHRYGFFQVINHGVSAETTEKMLYVANEFFQLPVEEKMKLYSDDPSKTRRLSTSFNVKKEEMLTWILGTGNDGDNCQSLHSGFSGKVILKIGQLEGRKKVVTGIAFHEASNKVYAAIKDGVLRVWDCSTGQCVDELNLGSEIGCLTIDGPWIFVGLGNLVKVYNLETTAPYSLNGPGGQVHALETMGNMLFAGTEDGSILVWKYNSETNFFQLITTLKGHTGRVFSLKVGQQSLYSGSADKTIQRWDLHSFLCTQTLTGHNADVTSLLVWENILFSSSLDKTIKAWTYTEAGCLNVFHTHNEEHGVLALFGMADADSKPILFCSCTDNSVHVYELPGFTERGKISAKQEVRAITSGPEGHFFLGDVAGGVAVWKWLHKQTAEAQERDPTHTQHGNLHSRFAGEGFSKLEQHERRKKDLKLKNKYVPEQFVGLEPLLNPLKFKDTQQRMCEHRESGICNDGDKCQFLHSSIMGKGISKTLLEEQNKAVTGIVSPAGSNKLYSGSKDGVFRIWEWHNGQCVKEFNFGSEIGCLTSKGPWIFAGLRDSVKVWSIQTATKFPDPPNGVNGQVYALETMGEDMLFDMLFAGMQDGSILAWKYISERNTFQLITTLRGHTSGVVSLKAGEQFLYSGSVDNTIRRWDLRTLQCTQTLTSHSAAITSLLFWRNHLFSSSLDKTIKAWFCTETGCSEVYTHNEKHGVLALFEMKDADNKSILVCSCTDNSVHLYELPSFTERGKLDANAAVLTMMSGPGGQFFTGDIKGQIAMWK